MSRSAALNYYHRVSKKNPEYRRRKAAYAVAYRAKNPRTRENWAHRAIPHVRHRARQYGVPFDIVEADIYVPEICPVLGVRLTFGGGFSPCSASLDRIVPALGYVKGNVAVISRRANMIKQDATAQQIRTVADWLESVS